MRPGRRAGLAVVAVGLAVTVGCTSDDPAGPATEASSPTPSSATTTATRVSPPAAAPSTSPPATAATGSPTATQPPPVLRFDVDHAVDSVRRLAGRIGPREAASLAYRRAAVWVARELRGYGYRVHRQRLRVPAGNSWGVDVPAGVTTNVIASSGSLGAAARYRVIGAHLDTVPQAPGAEDNASGVAVLLELARLAAAQPPTVPVVFVAFGGEEPRGDGEALHHFGSRAMVARMSAGRQHSIVGMVSMDRVGVGDVVPVCTGGAGSTAVRDELLAVGRRAGVATAACVNQSSDHWSFEVAGIPAARVGGTSYAAYHSAADRPAVVEPDQLRRVGRLMWSWLSG